MEPHLPGKTAKSDLSNISMEALSPIELYVRTPLRDTTNQYQAGGSGNRKSEIVDANVLSKSQNLQNSENEAVHELISSIHSTPKRAQDCDTESDTTADYESAGEVSPWEKQSNLSALADNLSKIHLSTPEKKVHTKINHFPFSPISAEDESDEEVTAIISCHSNSSNPGSLSLMKDDLTPKNNSYNNELTIPLLANSSQVIGTLEDVNTNNSFIVEKSEGFKTINKSQVDERSESFKAINENKLDERSVEDSHCHVESKSNSLTVNNIIEQKETISPSVEFQDAGPACSFHSEIMNSIVTQLQNGTMNSSMISNSSFIVEECRHSDLGEIESVLSKTINKTKNFEEFERNTEVQLEKSNTNISPDIQTSLENINNTNLDSLPQTTSASALRLANEKHPSCIEECPETISTLLSPKKLLEACDKQVIANSDVPEVINDVKETLQGADKSISDMCNLIESTFNNVTEEKNNVETRTIDMGLNQSQNLGNESNISSLVIKDNLVNESLKTHKQSEEVTNLEKLEDAKSEAILDSVLENLHTSVKSDTKTEAEISSVLITKPCRLSDIFNNETLPVSEKITQADREISQPAIAMESGSNHEIQTSPKIDSNCNISDAPEIQLSSNTVDSAAILDKSIDSSFKTSCVPQMDNSSDNQASNTVVISSTIPDNTLDSKSKTSDFSQIQRPSDSQGSNIAESPMVPNNASESNRTTSDTSQIQADSPVILENVVGSGCKTIDVSEIQLTSDNQGSTTTDSRIVLDNASDSNRKTSDVSQVNNYSDSQGLCPVNSAPIPDNTDLTTLSQIPISNTETVANVLTSNSTNTAITKEVFESNPPSVFLVESDNILGEKDEVSASMNAPTSNVFSDVKLGNTTDAPPLSKVASEMKDVLQNSELSKLSENQILKSGATSEMSLNPVETSHLENKERLKIKQDVTSLALSSKVSDLIPNLSGENKNTVHIIDNNPLEKSDVSNNENHNVERKSKKHFEYPPTSKSVISSSFHTEQSKLTDTTTFTASEKILCSENNLFLKTNHEIQNTTLASQVVPNENINIDTKKDLSNVTSIKPSQDNTFENNAVDQIIDNKSSIFIKSSDSVENNNMDILKTSVEMPAVISDVENNTKIAQVKIVDTTAAPLKSTVVTSEMETGEDKSAKNIGNSHSDESNTLRKAISLNTSVLPSSGNNEDEKIKVESLNINLNQSCTASSKDSSDKTISQSFNVPSGTSALATAEQCSINTIKVDSNYYSNSKSVIVENNSEDKIKLSTQNACVNDFSLAVKNNSVKKPNETSQLSSNISPLILDVNNEEMKNVASDHDSPNEKTESPTLNLQNIPSSNKNNTFDKIKLEPSNLSSLASAENGFRDWMDERTSSHEINSNGSASSQSTKNVQEKTSMNTKDSALNVTKTVDEKKAYMLNETFKASSPVLTKSVTGMNSYEDLLDKCSEQERLLGFDDSIKEEAEKIANEIAHLSVSESTTEQPGRLPSLNTNSAEAGRITVYEEIDNGDQFQDAAGFDFEYLSKIKGKCGNHKPIRESLFIQFDPLAASSTPEHGTPESVKAQPDSSSDAAPCGDEMLVCITPSIKHETPSPTSTTANLPKKRAQRYSSTPNFRQEVLSKEISKLQDIMLSQEEQNMALCKENDELRARIAELEDQLPEYDLRDELTSAIQKVNVLTTQNEKLILEKSSMRQLIDDYHETLADLMKKREEDQKIFEEEKEENKLHLKNLEIAFNDVHQKYEKSKEAIELFKYNEQAYKNSLAENQKSFKKMEENYNKLKDHATQKLQEANEEITRLKEEKERDLISLRAANKKLEIQIHTFKESLSQKDKEITELTKVFDELVKKYGT